MKTKLILLSAFFLVSAIVFTLTASAAIPHLMNYQGKATDKTGAPLNGTYNLTFRIYNTETSGSPKWYEIQPNITISNGIFQVQLGSINPLNLPFDEPYWISLEINSDGEMSPRTRLASVPYAYVAETSSNNIPTGAGMTWFTDTPPDGWLICDGRAISRASYAHLFSVMGSTYGAGDGVTTFNLPDLRARVIIGVNTTGALGSGSTVRTIKPLASAAGEETHLLTAAESGLPAHNHGDGAIGQNYSAAGFGALMGYPGDSNTVYPYGATNTTGPINASSAHNNLQPYIALNYIIKT